MPVRGVAVVVRGRAEEFEGAARSGAEIDEQHEGSRAERRIHGGFDFFLGHVQRADLIPLACMRLEIGLRRFRARLLHGGGPRAVARQSEIGRVEARHDGAGEHGFGAGIGEAEEHPGALAEAPDQPRFGHELEMPALAEDLGQVLDVQLAGREQRQDAQPRCLAGGAQASQRMGAGQAGRGLCSI